METRSPSNHHRLTASDPDRAHKPDDDACTPRSAIPPAEYSIAAVSKLTGASCHALRVWERRYGFPVPIRSASGHRRYSREQVRTLREITRMVQAGRPIGELMADLRGGRIAPAEESTAAVVPEDP